jgi:hypothetical protein
VSVQDETTPYVLPIQTWPLLAVEPKPLPTIVTGVPADPELVLMLVIVGVITVKEIALLTTPP